MIREFKNEQFVDFTVDQNQKLMEDAIKKVESELGKTYPLIIGGKRIITKDKFNSINPSNKDEVIGEFSKADKDAAEKAIKTAYKTFDEWKNVPADIRSRYLFKAASIMRDRKFELAATMILEEGKSWVEADGDVAEAIDFLEFYGRENMRLNLPQPLTEYEPEENNLYYIPLGVGAVIPPWNFPLAILVGMTSAALVTGNTVILKPASTSPLIGYKFMEILEEANLPPGVVNFVPGSGAVIGDFIVSHPKIRFICFTGSKEVGTRINALAAKVERDQIWIKRTILEMGGKDAILVDNSADLDSAAEGIVGSAFGFQGQKCSACSRLIIHKDVYNELVEKIVKRAKEIKVGQVKDRKNFMGPVIDEASYEKILKYIEIGKKEGKLVLGGNKAKGNGYFIEPTIIKDIAPNAKLAQEEIFGPVLAVIKADSFDHGLEIVNGTEFGLTGAVYSKSRMNLEKARRDFHVGNLYFNRKCTAALVGIHPFGGFNMSGTDSKAGGRDYLLLFTQAKLVSEKL
ncbi:L-glutamate gamma-semialdehyde dehydrogenase [candidate division KSB1 bacterium]